MAIAAHRFALPDNLIQLSSNDWSKELDRLSKVWNTGVKALFITGQSNSGKTDLAIRFGQQVCPGNTYLIRYTNTLRTTIADMPMLGYMQLPEDWSLSQNIYEERRCDEKLRILQHYYSDALFIVDGVDARTICQEPEYEKLMTLNARFIFTSRNRCDEETVYLSRNMGFTRSLLEKLDRLTLEQRRVLCCAALLSDLGLTMARFLRCLSADERKAVDILLEENLIAVRPEPIIAIRPDIREQYLRILHPTDVDCADFLTELSGFTVPKTCYSPEGYRQVAYCFANASKYLHDETGLFSRHAAQMFRDSGDYIPSFPHLEKRLACQLALQPRAELDLALALCETGAANWFQAISSSEIERKQMLEAQAIARIKEGVALYERNLDPAHPDLAEARMALAAVMQEKNWIIADEYAQETLDNQLAVLPEYDSALCSAYLCYAMLHYHWSQRKLRLEYAKKALKIMKQLDYIHKDMALVYSILSDCADTGEQRLEYALKALKICCLQTPWDQNGICKNMLRVAELNKRLGRYAAQKQYLMQAVNLMEAFLPPEHPKLVQHCEKVKKIKEEHDD